MTTPKLDSINLTYIEAAAQECLEFMGDLSFDQFLNDRKNAGRNSVANMRHR